MTLVTCARKKLNVNLQKFIEKVKRKTKKPVCVGFGISEPSHVETLKRQSNGIIIGSAITKIIEDNLGNRPMICKKIASFTKKIKKSTIY